MIVNLNNKIKLIYYSVKKSNIIVKTKYTKLYSNIKNWIIYNFIFLLIWNIIIKCKWKISHKYLLLYKCIMILI